MIALNLPNVLHECTMSLCHVCHHPHLNLPHIINPSHPDPEKNTMASLVPATVSFCGSASAPAPAALTVFDTRDKCSLSTSTIPL